MATTDRILRKLIDKIAVREGITDPDEVGKLLRHHWGEVTGVRRDFFLELRELLLQPTLDLEALGNAAQGQGAYILGGHSSTRARLKAFFEHERAPQLIRDLIGGGKIRPMRSRSIRSSKK